MSVHQSHCCVKHGCKYGEKNCPVVLGTVSQRCLCTDCSGDMQEDVEIFNLIVSLFLPLMSEKLANAKTNEVMRIVGRSHQNLSADDLCPYCHNLRNETGKCQCFDEFYRRSGKNEKANQRRKLKENENFIKFKNSVKPGDIVQCSGTKDGTGYRLVEKCDDFGIWGWKLRMIGKEWRQTGEVTQNGYGKITRIVREK